jgi:hypothetical protein
MSGLAAGMDTAAHHGCSRILCTAVTFESPRTSRRHYVIGLGPHLTAPHRLVEFVRRWANKPPGDAQTRRLDHFAFRRALDHPLTRKLFTISFPAE